MLSNYPDNMDWGAYDDYHDPKLTCGHNSSDGCDCWCEHNYMTDNTLLVIVMRLTAPFSYAKTVVLNYQMRSLRKPLTKTKYRPVECLEE